MNYSDETIDNIKLNTTKYIEVTQPSIAGHLDLNAVYNETNEIRIFGDANIAQYATLGDGSEGDPYILENYNLT